ncbi:hypothetical protein RI054_13g65080 [Pseudoscourfieldia marina]
MMTTNVRNMRSIVTASSAVLVALLAVVVMLSAVSGVSADSSTTTTYETTKYVDEYKSGYYGDEYKSGYYPKYKWWAPWTWKYSSNKYNDNKYDSGYDSGYSKYGSGYSKYDSGYGYSKYDSKYGVGPYYGKQTSRTSTTQTQYFYAKSEAHGLTFTLTNYYYNNEKLVCAIDDISRKSAICTMAGHFGGSYSTPEKCIFMFKTHQKGGKCIPHHMKLDCGKPPYVETSKFSKIDYRDIPHKDITTTTTTTTTCATTTTTTTTTTHAFEECTACVPGLYQVTINPLGDTKYTSCDAKPFGGETITLSNVAIQSIGDSVDPSAITVVSFPCITDSSQEVDFSFSGLFLFSQFPNLEEVRFANWVTGPDGSFKFEADFGGNSLTSIYAPRLEGNSTLSVQIDSNPMLTSVDLSALKEAGSVSIFANRELVDVKLPELTTVTNAFEIFDNPNLTSVDLSALKEAGEIDIFDNPELVDVKLPELTTVTNAFEIFDNPNLTSVDLSALKEAGSVSIFANRELVDVKLPELTTVTNAFEIFDNPNLTSVDLSALKEAGEIDIFDNRELVDVKLSELTTVANLIQIRDNPNLPSVDLSALKEAGEIDIRDNPNLLSVDLSALKAGEIDVRLTSNLTGFRQSESSDTLRTQP